MKDRKIHIRERSNDTAIIVGKNLRLIKARLKDGHAVTHIAIEIGVSPDNLQRELNRNDLRNYELKGSKYDPYYKTIKRMRKNGYSLTEIAYEISGNPNGISWYCERMKIPCGRKE
ncbi:hypothetical protein MASR2M29_02070 [Spirochaetota bacterium]